MSKRKTTATRAATRTTTRPAPRTVKSRTPVRSKRRRVAAPMDRHPLSVKTTTEEDQSEAPTERQMEIYSFIRDKIRSRGYGPTVREIGTAFKIRSPNGVVSRGKNMSRAIELCNEPAHLSGLKMAGWVAAGTLRVAEEQMERIDFESLFYHEDHFVLKVMGDSMIDAQIADGDWVVIKTAKSARAGDIVVAQTEDGEATLKHWFPERDRIRLQPANASMKPIYVRNAKVLGVLVGVVRKT